LARAEIFAGICGFTTIVTTRMEGEKCRVTIEGGCNAIQKLASELTLVDPYQEISARRSIPLTLQMGLKHCTHAACPVPVGIIKAIEVEAHLALPKDVSIRLSKEGD
jgi:hypothetical protein